MAFLSDPFGVNNLFLNAFGLEEERYTEKEMMNANICHSALDEEPETGDPRTYFGRMKLSLYYHLNLPLEQWRTICSLCNELITQLHLLHQDWKFGFITSDDFQTELRVVRAGFERTLLTRLPDESMTAGESWLRRFWFGLEEKYS